jgi:hypothetical protein
VGVSKQLTLDGILNRCIVEPDDCVRWDGAHDGKGYPHCQYEGKTRRVFRILYEIAFGEIQNELLHHRCENKWCVNPGHAEDITKSEHHAFKHPLTLRTHCSKGHEMTDENTYTLHVGRNNYQYKCRTCERERKSTPEYLAYMRAYYYRRKAERGA